MKFLMMIKGNADSETGVMPSQEAFAAMTEFNEQLSKAGMLVDLNGLHPTKDGAKVKFGGGKPQVINGPFPEQKDVVAGYWVIQADSLQDAIDWAKKVPGDPKNPNVQGEIEIRPIFELDEFEPGPGIDRARQFEKELTKSR
jgi:hypothetical protein